MRSCLPRLGLRPVRQSVKLADNPRAHPSQPRAGPGFEIGPPLAETPVVAVDLDRYAAGVADVPPRAAHRPRGQRREPRHARLPPIDLTRRTADDPAALAVTNEGHIAAPATADYVTSFDDGGAAAGLATATRSRSSASCRRSTPTAPATRPPPSWSRAGSRCCATPQETAPDERPWISSPRWKSPRPACRPSARG